MNSTMRSSAPTLGSRSAPRLSLGRAAPLVCKALKRQQPKQLEVEAEKPHFAQALALPLAGMIAAAMITGALIPEEAMAARSGGRVGGGGFSSGRSMGRSAAPRAAPAPQSSTRTYNSYSSYSAPPVVIAGGGYGYGMSPFGFGGGFMPMGFGFGGGGLFQFFFLMAAVSVVFNVVSSFASRAAETKDDSKKGGSDKDGDGWGDL